jgi:cytochrome c oxidase cbb3-type subunit III
MSGWAWLGGLLLLCACEREDRPFSRLSPERKSSSAEHMVKNAYAISEGQRLFDWFNCSGCHGGRGGGHIGPALTDAEWRYGSSVEEVRRSIADGRPQGMPAYRGLITDDELWQLSAYVMSLSGRVSQAAAAGRADGISKGEPPTMRSEQRPKAERVNQ